MFITVIKDNQTNIYEVHNEVNLFSYLIENKYYLSASCGGKGTCGKCKVKLLKGKIDSTTADENNFILACKAIITSDITIEIPNIQGKGLLNSYTTDNTYDDKIAESGFGIAIDIGTTTIAAYLVDLTNGTELQSYSCLNPQGALGADVISRINACAEGKLDLLHGLIIEECNKIIRYFKKNNSITNIKKMSICGNTTMMHLFAGIDASPLGQYPFKPVFVEKKEYLGETLNLDVEKVILLPSISAFVGSDISAGILSAGLTKGNQNKLLIDIGTNGEMVLFNNGKLSCSSTAAGPAFEGAKIDCGMGGVEGAIGSAEYKNSNLNFDVINDVKAQGICGSGLIDLISIMVENHIIDKTGAFNDNIDDKFLAQKVKGNKFYITDDIYISQKDIREFQLAKSAIYAGIKTMASLLDLTLNDFEKVFIAGGLGFYINQKNAIKIGLIPKEFENNLEIVGNSAGAGAKLCLVSNNNLKECEKLTQSCISIDFSTNSLFMDEYIDNMSF